MKVLVKEKIADSGVDLLRENFDVDLGLEMSEQELRDSIGRYDAILVRSATQVTPELIERAERLKVIGRAGTGVDNVDIPAATRRGIVVANAPESNSVAAAEHTLALMLALCRNVPQAQATLVGGAWERSALQGRRALRQDARRRRLRPDRPAGREARTGLRDGRRSPSTSSSPPSASASSASRASTDLERPLRPRRRRHPARAEDAGDDRPDRLRRDRRDEGRRAPRQLRPRRAGRPRRCCWRRSSRASWPAPPSTSSPPSRSPTIRSSPARTSSSRLTWAPRPPRPRTAPASSPPSR